MVHLRALASLALCLGAAAAAGESVCKDSNLPPTNGQQLTGGSCSDTVLGQIPSTDNMISTLIVEPKNGAKVEANTEVTFKIRVINLETGNFNEPPTEVYYLEPQTLNGNGVVKGHAHLTCQSLGDQDSPPDASSDALEFFQGLNDVARNGVLTQVVPGFGNQGVVRCCVMVGAAAHQPPVMPVAQRGSVDDCIRIEVI